MMIDLYLGLLVLCLGALCGVLSFYVGKELVLRVAHPNFVRLSCVIRTGVFLLLFNNCLYSGLPLHVTALVVLAWWGGWHTMKAMTHLRPLSCPRIIYRDFVRG